MSGKSNVVIDNSTGRASTSPPLVSVIMPSYNCEAFIAESIKSVQMQTLTSWELCIVDDCSKDDSVKIIKRLQKEDPRIRLEQLEENCGAAVARSRALEMAEGRYVAFLDADDLWHPEKLEKQIAFMESNHIPFSATAYRLIDERGHSMNKKMIPPRLTDFNKMYYLGDPIGNLTVIYDQKALGCIKVPNVRKRNDYALWLEVLKRTEYCYGMKEVLASYRIRSNSISRDKKKLIRYQWDLYRNVEKFNFGKCILGIMTWGIVKTCGIQFP